MRYLIAVVCVLALACGGCASITTGELQSVAIQTQRADGAAVDKAECKLTNDKGFWSAITPAVVTVARSGSALNIACSKEGEPSGTAMAISRVHGGMVGNLILGGLIGVMIDHASGSGYEYPDRIEVVMGQSRLQDRKDQNGAAQAAVSAPAAGAVAATSAPAPVAPVAPAGPRTPVTGSALLDLSRDLGKVSPTPPSQVHSMEFQPDGVVVVNFANSSKRGLYKTSSGGDRLCLSFSLLQWEHGRTIDYLNDCFTVYRVTDGHFVMRAANSDFEVAYQK